MEITPFVAALPKTELHLHLVGAASPSTVLGLARRHPDAGVPTEPDALTKFYRFRDFTHFIHNYATVDSLVRDADDVCALVLGLASDAAASNVRYAEVTVTASMHLANGITAAELADALTTTRARARADHGVELNWIFDIPAGLGPWHVPTTTDFALRQRPEGTVALGLAGMEDGQPRASFRESFDVARAAGLHAVVHAGETTGPEEVAAAIDVLGAERVGHGVGAARDEGLLRRIAERGITVEVCPTSNVCTGAVPDIASHPLPSFLAHGVPTALSTDDPGMFHTTLDGEYMLAQQQFGLENSVLAEIARTGVRASYAGDDTKRALLAGIDEIDR